MDTTVETAPRGGTGARTETAPEGPTRLLLVEDSDHDRRFFRRVLEAAAGEFEVVERPDAESALELLRQERFDLLVADLNMPGMSGIELVRAAGPLLSDTRALILTGSRSVDAAAEAVRLRVADYIFKEPREALRETLVPQLRAAARENRLVRENRRLQRELEVRLAFLEQIHQQLPDAVFAILDAEGRVLERAGRAGAGAGERGDDRGDAPGVEEILAPLSRELARTVGELVRRERGVHNQYLEAPAEGGRRALWLLGLRPLEDSGAARWILTVRDVTPERSEEAPVAENFRGIVGRDPSIQRVCELVRRVAPMPISVLITGPTGAGKDMVARAIHEESDRRDKPFIAVNCTALSSEILESELFGHVRGAFTGAINPRKGRFREADGGTLFLDEIGETSESFQAKLLRALDSGEIEPVGQDRPVKVDVRILCATNRDLPELIRKGRFREDLYYRINVVHVEVPPLAARPGDVPALVEHFRREFNARFARSIRFVSREATGALMNHSWPGNIRELRHVLERAFVVADGPMITLADLPPYLGGEGGVRGARELAAPRQAFAGAATRGDDAPAPQGASVGGTTFGGASGDQDAPAGRSAAPAFGTDRFSAVEREEIDRIRRALAEADGNIGQASKLLDMHRTTLWRKMKQYGLEA